MSTWPFIGEIALLPYTFVPRDYAACQGAPMPINQFPALFSIIGTYYGGDGRVSFNLPHLGGRVPMHWGWGPGLSNHVIGRVGGVTHVNLQPQNLPEHHHTLDAVIEFPPSTAVSDPASTFNVARQSDGATAARVYNSDPDLAPTTPFAEAAVTVSGGAVGHENRQPWLTIRFCIALDGQYPSRS